MFDISWTEFMLIGVVALIVIGPKDLPGVLRTLGQWTRKVRGMAAEFQNQFQEAMREAEMGDLKKQVDDMAKDFKDFDPLKGVRTDVEAAGRDIERSFKDKPAAIPAASEPVATEPVALERPPDAPAAAATPAAAALPATVVPGAPIEASELESVGAPVEASELESVGAPAPTPSPEPPAKAPPPDETGRPA
jgi:sec-independent protein translocase protein TatB